MNEYLFSYGTLQKEKIQLELFGRIFQRSADTLIGYKVAEIEIKDEAFLAKGEQKNQLTAITSNDKNDNIKGTVLELTGEELLLTDKYEPSNYKRITVVLESGKEAGFMLPLKLPDILCCNWCFLLLTAPIIIQKVVILIPLLHEFIST